LNSNNHEFTSPSVIKLLLVQEHEIENILESLYGIKRASIAGSLYEKVRLRLDTPDNSFIYKLGIALTRPTLAISLAVLVLIFNLLLLKSDVNDSSRTDEGVDYTTATAKDFDEMVFGIVPENQYVYNY